MKKRIISILLSALCVCTFACGCNGETETPTGTAREKYKYTKGVHDLTAPESSSYMVENGKCDYQILLPAEMDSNLIVAEAELKYFFEEATGVKLSTLTEPAAGMAHTATGKYISIGSTKMLQSAGMDLKADVLGSEGVRIVTKDNAVYVTGATSTATLNAVYTFLNIMFDYEQFAYDCFTLT